MTATAWDPNRKGVHVVLSQGNLLATKSVATDGFYDNVYSTTSRSGKRCFKVTCVSAFNLGIGLGNALAPVDGVDNVNWLGGDPSGSSLSIYQAGPVWFQGNDIAETGLSYGTGDFLLVAVDPVAQLIWYRLNNAGNWNGTVGGATANPATGLGGISFAGLNGDVYAGVELSGNDGGTDAALIDFAPTETLPAGFLTWDAPGGADGSARDRENWRLDQIRPRQTSLATAQSIILARARDKRAEEVRQAKAKADRVAAAKAKEAAEIAARAAELTSLVADMRAFHDAQLRQDDEDLAILLSD